MKINMHKHRSLRNQLLILPVAVMIIMALLCSALLLLEHHAAIMLSKSLEKNKHYNHFETSMNEFQSTFTLYSNSFDRKYLTTYQEQLNSITSSTEAMKSDFPDEEIVLHNCDLVAQYIGEINSLIANSAVISITEFSSGFANVERIYNQIQENSRSVLMLYMQNIVQCSDQSIELWNMQIRFSIALVAIVLLLLLITVNKTVHSIVSPIMRLVHYAKRITLGDYDYYFEMPKVSQEDEISLLTTTFINMVETIKTQTHDLQDKIELTERLHALEKQNLQIQLSLAEKEMVLMQSMINPHFLFNCLGTVSSMAVLENAPRTQSISTKIAHYLRNSIEFVGSHITLREEVDLIREYIYIQSLRFGDRISVDVICSPECEGALVPAMFLQPLIENAFIHGLHNCTQNGRIEVIILLRSDQKVGIRIADNGVGISPERLNNLQNEIRAPFQTEHPHIGLHSVISQLNIMFHNQYSFEIESIPNHGTTILILLPYLRNEDCKELGQEN